MRKIVYSLVASLALVSCKQQAVEIAGKPTIAERQYHHPNVKLRDLLRRE